MTLEETNITEEQLKNVRDRSLEAAYEVHDLGHDIIVARMEAHGFEVEEHGDDARHADEVFYGQGPDLAIYDNGELVTYIEVKTKEAEEWFGRCNLRHYREYVNFTNEVDVPVFIWFALVNEDTSFVHREAFVEVEDLGQLDGEVRDVTESEVVFYEEDAYEIDGDDGLLAVDGGDVVGVRSSETIVDWIPEVHGNEVVELNDDAFRSFPHFLHRIDSDDGSEE